MRQCKEFYFEKYCFSTCERVIENTKKIKDKIGSPERASLVRDLPAGGARMVAKASGISHLVVNGAALYRDGKHTGEFPGHVLRLY